MNVCFQCIGEEYLKSEIKNKGVRQKCDYCGKVAKSYTIEQLSLEIESAFERHYIRTPQDPDSIQERMMNDEESNYLWARSGDPVIEAIMDAADIELEVATDVQEFLGNKNFSKSSWDIQEETEFSSESYYEEKKATSEHWQNEWNDFEKSLKNGTRFFNSLGLSHLESIFKGINEMKTRDKRPAVVVAGPGKSISGLYRARVFQTDEQLRVALSDPAQQLGPAPPKLSSSGRMNAAGISVFYGATEKGLALAEVRPPVGSSVLIACFDLLREIRLLDLAAISSMNVSGSIFDRNLLREVERAAFLRDWSFRTTRPVLPDDAQFDYLPTQAVSDYLAAHPSLNIDGIIFPSSQKIGSGTNVVLFHKASKVKTQTFPQGTEISASTYYWDEDGPYPDYMVSVAMPNKGKGKKKKESPFLFREERIKVSDDRHDTLKILPESMSVHLIKEVNYKTDDYSVSWRSYEKVEISKNKMGNAFDWQ